MVVQMLFLGFYTLRLLYILNYVFLLNLRSPFDANEEQFRPFNSSSVLPSIAHMNGNNNNSLPHLNFVRTFGTLNVIIAEFNSLNLAI